MPLSLRYGCLIEIFVRVLTILEDRKFCLARGQGSFSLRFAVGSEGFAHSCLRFFPRAKTKSDELKKRVGEENPRESTESFQRRKTAATDAVVFLCAVRANTVPAGGAEISAFRVDGFFAAATGGGRGIIDRHFFPPYSQVCPKFSQKILFPYRALGRNDSDVFSAALSKTNSKQGELF
jgi:hypothetical protein